MDDSASSLRSSVLSRRHMLAAAGSSLVAFLAGCSSSNDQSATDTPESPPATSPTATGTAGTDTPTQESGTDTPPQKVPISDVSGIPMKGFTAARRYYAPDEYGPRKNLTQRWRRSPAQEGELTQPVVVDGTIYTASVNAAQKLYALNAADGSKEWTFTPPSEATTGGEEPRTSGAPAVVGDTVIIGSTSGTLYGLQRSDGSIKWRFRTTPKATRWTAPAVAGGTVYATADGEKIPGTVYAVAADTGNKQWERQVTANTGWKVVSSPTVGSNALCVIERTDQVTLHCLDPASGSTRWTKRGVGTQYRPVTVAHKTVYARQFEGGYTVALSISDGSRRWRRKARDGKLMRVVAVADELAFISGENGIVAVSPTTGEEQWRRNFRSFNAVAGNSALYAGIEGAESGGIRVLSMSDGQTLTEETGLATDPDRIVVVDGYIFVVGGLGLWALGSA